MNLIQANALEIRQRLRNPPGGRVSSEIEVVAEPIARRQRIEAQGRAEALLRQARERRAQELLDVYALKLRAWVNSSDDEPKDVIPRRITCAQILQAVSLFYDIPVINIISQRRTGRLIKPRMLAMYIAAEDTDLSMPMIGARIGDRDHTTILHGKNKIATAIASHDREVIHAVSEIRKLIALSTEPSAESPAAPEIVAE